MNPVMARVIAAVGIVLGVVSIWTPLVKSDFGPKPTYWNSPHHSLGIALLVLAVLAGLGVLLGFAQSSSLFDRLWLLAGVTAGGLYLFYPIVVTANSSASDMRVGAWLGAAAFVLFVVAGALLPLSAASERQSWVTAPAAPTTAPPMVESSEPAPVVEPSEPMPPVEASEPMSDEPEPGA